MGLKTRCWQKQEAQASMRTAPHQEAQLSLPPWSLSISPFISDHIFLGRGVGPDSGVTATE